METAPVAAIVLAAGQGTRMKSKLPKVLHPLGGKALLGHAVEAVKGLEPIKLCVVIRHQKELLAEYLGNEYPQVLLAEQDEIPGTGRAVQCGLTALVENGVTSGTLVVTSGDVPLLETNTLAEMILAHQRAKAAVTVLTTEVENPAGYGRIVRNSNGEVTQIVEHKDATSDQLKIKEINAGIYAFEIEFLLKVLGNLDQNNEQGEVYLTDTIAQAATLGLSRVAFLLKDSWQAQGCNDRIQLAVLGKEHNRRVLEKLMQNGVSVVSPENTWVEASVDISPDVTLLPGCILQGNTRIGEGAIIGPYTTLSDVTVEAGREIRYSDLSDQ